MEEDNEIDGAIFSLDDSTEKKISTPPKRQAMKHPAARTLDACIEQMFDYIHDSCHIDGKIDVDPLKGVYNDLLHIFEELILPTCGHHVQFLLFYVCSFKVAVAEAFVKFLWQKVSNPNVPYFLRQQAVAYIVSLLARATFIPLSLLQGVLSEMASWVHAYICSQDMMECANSDVRVHAVFFAICQGMFYLIAFRHKDMTNGKKSKSKLIYIIAGITVFSLFPCVFPFIIKYASFKYRIF